MIWRKNGKIYVLDDPTTIYDLVYQYTIMEPIFNPATQATLKTSKPTITITYLERVTLISALLNDQNIINQIASTNQISFVYMPSSDLKDGTYLLSITAEDQSGNKLTSTAIYTISTELSSVQNAVIIALIIIIIIAIIILILLYKKGLIFK